MTLPAALVEYLERSPDAAVVFDADGAELWRNTRTTPAILEAIGRLKSDLLPPERAVTVGSLSILVVRYGDVFVATARDVAGLGRDALTGLLDRTVFDTHLEQAVAAGSRGRSAALLYIDVDGLKRVNDADGHQAGDRFLVAFAERLRAAVRAEDVVARVGGDEFAVLVRNVDAIDVGALAVHVHKRLGVPVSIGVDLIDGSLPRQDVIARADRACYAAKAKGGDRVELPL